MGPHLSGAGGRRVAHWTGRQAFGDAPDNVVAEDSPAWGRERAAGGAAGRRPLARWDTGPPSKP
ncbi:protein of unknown function [Kyrpidia spormannii]|uniref:Uncharacterized protein n=2 Tax=Kyrpidia spormannii TaxID=2055160 RepID=A0ACA8ZCX9_9BACL|nr:protein of unknown function [Kyrpidia spormannii]CAB3396102.1 protein of unknown function [Kyrpidia spormannii]